MDKQKRGGKRIGAGRPTKRGKTVRKSFRLVEQELDTAMLKSGLSANGTVEMLIKEYIKE